MDDGRTICFNTLEPLIESLDDAVVQQTLRLLSHDGQQLLPEEVLVVLAALLGCPDGERLFLQQTLSAASSSASACDERVSADVSHLRSPANTFPKKHLEKRTD